MDFVLRHRTLRGKVSTLHCVDFAVILLLFVCGADSDDVLCADSDDRRHWRGVATQIVCELGFVTRALLLLIRVMVLRLTERGKASEAQTAISFLFGVARFPLRFAARSPPRNARRAAVLESLC